MQMILEQTTRIEQTLEQHVQTAAHVQVMERTTNALNWLSRLSPIDHEEKHNEVRKHRVPATGRWFLNDPSFVGWQHSPDSADSSTRR